MAQTSVERLVSSGPTATKAIAGPVLAVFAAYATGSLCAGYYLVRAVRGVDVRRFGSGSAGGTNAARLLGLWALPVVFALDAFKGAFVTWMALRADAQAALVGAVAVAVVAGHVFPVQLRFRGGRGVSPSIGVLLVYDPVLLIPLLSVGGVVVAIKRDFVLAGKLAYALLPVCAVAMQREPVAVASIGLMSLVVVGAHFRRRGISVPQGG